MTVQEQLAQMIAQQETSSGTAGVGVTLNNPGAIMYAPWESTYGATQSKSGFASFPTLQSGYDALNNLISGYIKSGASIESMMNAYAPPSVNPTTPDRIQQISQTLGISPKSPIASQTVTDPEAPTTPGTTTEPSSSGSTVTPQAAPTDSWSSRFWAGLWQGLGLTDEGDGGFDWVRVMAGIVGVVLLIMGLMQLKQAQVIVENVQKAGKKIGEYVATA